MDGKENDATQRGEELSTETVLLVIIQFKNLIWIEPWKTIQLIIQSIQKIKQGTHTSGS